MTGILVLNAGSSSVKFSLFQAGSDAALAALARGQIEGLGTPAPRLAARGPGGEPLPPRALPAAAPEAMAGSHAAAIAALVDWLDDMPAAGGLAAVGHRVVHGGAGFTAPVAVDAEVRARLAALVPLAPLHQPHNLAGIDAAAAHFPGVPQVVCFDTAFHRSQSRVAETYALPRHFYDRGLRRYGFHGLSYEWIADRLRATAPEAARGRVVALHLGNGASACAMREGRSVETSMGFTALDGLPMGTRCGQIDPGLVLHLLGAEGGGMTPESLTRLLYRESGLKGLSGIGQDMRALLASESEAAREAVAHFAHRARREVGALAATLGGLDALVFSAGIGENAAPVRAMICDGLDFLGVALDPAANARNAPDLAAPGARVRTLIVPTDEEAMIARHALALLNARPRAG